MIPFATPKLVLGIGATMAAIYSADQFFARLEQRELDAQARHEYAAGQTLLRGGRTREAIEAFRRARVLNRENPSFETALASALISDHQPERAEEALSGILERDSNDGAANLLMARAMNEQQQFASANSYYHRAIYGTWPRNMQSRQTDARIELVHWLAARRDQKGLLSELILLEPLAASDVRVARELPLLFSEAGSSSRAIDAYRGWLRANPGDAEAYAGLGETEIQIGNFRAARQAFDRAVELKPHDADFRQRGEVARSALELDPTPRWLSSKDKLERSNRILELAVSCSSESSLLEKAQKLIAEKKPAITNEAAETRLSYAETIWNTRPESCTQPPRNNELLAALIHKLTE